MCCGIRSPSKISQLLSCMQALQDLVRGVRNSRADYGVELGRKIAATLHVQDATLRFGTLLKAQRNGSYAADMRLLPVGTGQIESSQYIKASQAVSLYGTGFWGIEWTEYRGNCELRKDKPF